MKSDYLHPSLYQKLFGVMQWPNVLAIRVSLETGLRIDDVLSLRPENLRARSISFTAKKTGKSGTKKISSDLARHLRACAGKDWLFPGRDPAKHRTRQTVWRDVKKAARVQGISGQISPHSARKSYAVELRKEEGLAAVQRELQHSNAETTNLYAFADVLTGERTQGNGLRNLVISPENMEIFAEMIAEKVFSRLKKQ